MNIQYKSVQVSGVAPVEDEGDGIITAYVSITGVEDNVNDVIEPGSYSKTLTKRIPKGVWAHQWLTPTAKTLEAEELMPGSADLPKELSDGTPWPQEAGALRVKMQFNMKTARGREAYHDVKFFGDQQEWSIGYKVPEGGAYKKNGKRYIKELDLFEYSPVLFGAMSHARTQMKDLKDEDNASDNIAAIQIQWKQFQGEDATEIKSWEDRIIEYKEEHGVDVHVEGESTSDNEGDESDGDEEEYDDDFDDDGSYEDEEDDENLNDEEEDERKSYADPLDPNHIRMVIKSLNEILEASGASGVEVEFDTTPLDSKSIMVDGGQAFIEAKATGYERVADAVEDLDVNITADDFKALKDAAVALDSAIEAEDQTAKEEAAVELIEILEELIPEVEKEDDADGLKVVARTLADKMGGYDEEDEEDEDEEESSDDVDGETDDDEEDDEKKSYFSESGVEYKNVAFSGQRVYGMPKGAEPLEGKAKIRAFIGGLDNDVLLCLKSYVENMRGENFIKSSAAHEIDDRTMLGVLSEEEKVRHVRSAAGAARYGLPIGSPIGGSGRMGGDTPATLLGPKKRPAKWVRDNGAAGAGGGGQTGRGGGTQRQRAEGRGPGNGGRSNKPGDTRIVSAMRLIGNNNAARQRKLRSFSDEEISTELATIRKQMTKLSGGKTYMARSQHEMLRGMTNLLEGEYERRARAARRGKKTAQTDNETKRDFTSGQRDQAAEKGHAMEDGSFPIKSETDLKNAIRACGRAKDTEEAKSHIKKRAKEMGKESLLPDSWKMEVIDLSELKGLEEFLETKDLLS